MKAASDFTVMGYFLLILLSPLFVTAAHNHCGVFATDTALYKQLQEPVNRTWHPQQVSPAIHCPADMDNDFYSCIAREGHGDVETIKGCAGAPHIRGGVHTTSFANVSTSPDQLENLINIVNDALLRVTDNDQLMFTKTHLCLNSRYRTRNDADLQSQISFGHNCLFPGTTAYIQFTPLLYCAEGTLSKCSGQGSLKENMPIKVCGAQTLVQPKDPNKVIQGLFDKVQVDPSEIDRYKENPATMGAGQFACNQVGKAIKNKKNSATAVFAPRMTVTTTVLVAASVLFF